MLEVSLEKETKTGLSMAASHHGYALTSMFSNNMFLDISCRVARGKKLSSVLALLAVFILWKYDSLDFQHILAASLSFIDNDIPSNHLKARERMYVSTTK